MEKKMLKLVVFVLVIGLTASFAHAADVLWDGGGTDDYWTTPENWVGDVLPNTTADYGMIDDPLASQPLIEDGVVASAYRVVVGQENGPCTLTVTGGSITSLGLAFTIGRRSTAGIGGILDISGGAVTGEEGVLAANGGGSNGTINMSGGTLTVRGTTPSTYHQNFVIGDHGLGTLNMSDGLITAEDNMYLAYSLDGTGVVNMTGGTINVGDTIYLSGNASADSEFHLDGGVVTAAGLVMTSLGSLDLTEGEMRLAGDDSSIVLGYINSGLITGYGDSDNVRFNFDGTDTIITAVPEPVTIVLLGLGGLLSLRRRRQA